MMKQKIFYLTLLLLLILSAAGLTSCAKPAPIQQQIAQTQQEQILEEGKQYAQAVIASSDATAEEKAAAKEMVDSMSIKWPTDLLPAGFPAYPADEMYSTGAEGTVHIIISNTDEDTFNNYVATLEKAGWEFEEIPMTGFKQASKGDIQAVLIYDDGSVNITVAQEQE